MKVIYYSRTGNTKKIGEEIAKKLRCKTEELKDDMNRKGIIGWIKCGREAAKKDMPKINKIKHHPEKENLVIIGTPVWANTMAGPVRTYLAKNNFKKVAFFCTYGGSPSHTFEDMQELTKKPQATISIKASNIKKNDYSLKQFIADLK